MKKRIIPSVLLSSGTNVSLSQQFSPWRTVGTLAQQLRLHVNRSCDELLIINLPCAGKKFIQSDRIFSLIRKEVDVPIAYAGGIMSVDDASRCINSGFDKVYLTSTFLDNRECLSRIVDVLGSQSVGVCLPYRYQATHQGKLQPYVWDFRCCRFVPDLSLEAAILDALIHKVGEVLLFNVDRDGSMNGLDSDVVQIIDRLSPSLPILLSGGASSCSDFSKVLLNKNIQGVVASSIFSLTQETPATIRDYCEKQGIAMRRV